MNRYIRFFSSVLLLSLSSTILLLAGGTVNAQCPGVTPVRFETPTSAPIVVADCLITPTSMTLDEKTDTLYITELGTGRVVSIHIAP